MNENKERVEKQVSVPYVVFETVVARKDRHIEHILIALVIAIFLIFASNGIWLYCWMQYDYGTETYTVETQGAGNANFIGESGDIYNGQDYGAENYENEKNW